MVQTLGRICIYTPKLHTWLIDEGNINKNPADSLPSRDSAKNMVWSAQQLSFLIENCLKQDIAFCLRLQPFQCFCAWNESNCQRSFFLCQHSQLCQSLACFHKQRLWTKFPTPWLAADVFPHQRIGFTIGVSAQRINTYVTSCTWTISKHINSRTTTSAQRINTYVTSMKMIHEEHTIKNVITPPPPPHPPPPNPPQPTPSVSTPISRQWKRMLTYSCICQRDVYVYSSICQPHTTPSSCCHEASRSGVTY